MVSLRDIQVSYPKNKNVGRPHVPAATMRKLHYIRMKTGKKLGDILTEAVDDYFEKFNNEG